MTNTSDIYSFRGGNGKLQQQQQLHYRSGAGGRYPSHYSTEHHDLDNVSLSDAEDASMAAKGAKMHHHHHGGDGNNVGDQLYNRSQMEPTKGWDVFIVTPPEDEDETLSSKWVEKFLRMLKLLTILLTFIIVVACAVLSKGIVLFMTSMIRSNRTVSVCAQSIPGLERDKKYLAVFAADDPERVAWIWSLFFILIVPELMTLFRSARICIFKSYHLPSKQTFLLVSGSLLAAHSQTYHFYFIFE